MRKRGGIFWYEPRGESPVKLGDTLPASDEELAEAEAVFSKRGNLHIIRNGLARLSPRAIARIAAAVLAEIASA